MAKKCYEDIKKYVESFGYTLLNEVSGTKETMKLTCPNGHNWERNFGDFKYGSRCTYCSKEKEKSTKT